MWRRGRRREATECLRERDEREKKKEREFELGIYPGSTGRRKHFTAAFRNGLGKG